MKNWQLIQKWAERISDGDEELYQGFSLSAQGRFLYSDKYGRDIYAIHCGRFILMDGTTGQFPPMSPSRGQINSQIRATNNWGNDGPVPVVISTSFEVLQRVIGNVDMPINTDRMDYLSSDRVHNLDELRVEAGFDWGDYHIFYIRGNYWVFGRYWGKNKQNFAFSSRIRNGYLSDLIPQECYLTANELNNLKQMEDSPGINIPYLVNGRKILRRGIKRQGDLFFIPVEAVNKPNTRIFQNNSNLIEDFMCEKVIALRSEVDLYLKFDYVSNRVDSLYPTVASSRHSFTDVAVGQFATTSFGGNSIPSSPELLVRGVVRHPEHSNVKLEVVNDKHRKSGGWFIVRKNGALESYSANLTRSGRANSD
jgi:hypothetical protein